MLAASFSLCRIAPAARRIGPRPLQAVAGPWALQLRKQFGGLDLEAAKVNRGLFDGQL